MSEKLDFKKAYKDLYLPGKAPALVQVPPMVFMLVDGAGAPEDSAYQNSTGALYTLAFTIKMSKMNGTQPPGYQDFVVPPLEGLWATSSGRFDAERAAWRWTSMLRQPEFVTPEVFEAAKAQAAAKKPELDFSAVRLQRWEEGLCVQALHLGPYSTETDTLEMMEAFMGKNGLAPDFEPASEGLGRRHHELYLNDPRRTAPDKLRTVLRQPVFQQ